MFTDSIKRLQQVSYSLGTFVEEEVEDGEPRQEAVSLTVDLVIGLHGEDRAQGFCLRGDECAVVRGLGELFGGDKSLGEIEHYVKVEEAAHQFGGRLVVVQEIFHAHRRRGAFVDEERTYVVLIVFEECRFAVGCQQCLPVEVSPVAVVGNLHILNLQALSVGHGDGQRLCPVGGGYDAAVAESLFPERFAGFDIYARTCAMAQEGVPLHRSEVCCREKQGR